MSVLIAWVPCVASNIIEVPLPLGQDIRVIINASWFLITESHLPTCEGNDLVDMADSLRESCRLQLSPWLARLNALEQLRHLLELLHLCRRHRQRLLHEAVAWARGREPSQQGIKSGYMIEEKVRDETDDDHTDPQSLFTVSGCLSLARRRNFSKVFLSSAGLHPAI
jgi:hypothetical protein